jgi:putative ATP-dependent endonuclease of OLD family
MNFLEGQAVSNTQVILTSHSPSFASSARVGRLTVLAKSADRSVNAFVPASFGLEEAQLQYLHRFLDVTKAALVFARGVILVEGIAEQLLMPVIARKLGRPLAPSGVTVINVGGVAFPPFTELFGPNRLPYRLAVVSDGDRRPAAGDPPEEVPAPLSPRAANLLGRAGENISVQLAERTLEWDLAAAGNVGVMLRALAIVKPRAGPALAKDLEGADPKAAADAILESVAEIKGPFAQALAAVLDEDDEEFVIPEYLRNAIAWVAEELAAA